MPRTHGMSNKPWYNSYRSMMQRCYNKNNASYQYYGGKGITVCEEWKNPLNFGDWAENNGFVEGLTIDRIDGERNYCPDNCRWSNKKIQAENRRSTRNITHNGETHSVTEWSNKLGVNRSALLNRLWRGWSEEEIFDKRKYSNQYERRG